ncbi:hypothetical protein C5167_042579 [Papaver somniferum]|uniref:SKP1-like protein n=1 Tax=Papaver somniferum TaxID=3469 RepID=A0A4Y7L374_PAPSO|nr:SKP1-like protein 1 [Papaver somniferum]RZC80003.1 hypothetical protein C5167_042579 [Papaver somniferum]
MSKMISLRSSDGDIFEIDEISAHQSLTIKHMIEDGCADDAIPLHNVTSKILEKVIEYCNKHGESTTAGGDSIISKADKEALEKWDKEFVKLDQAILSGLIKAANYLNIKSLLDLTCITIADMIRGKTVEEIRKTFNIRNDFTPEEEEAVRRENQWTFN